MHHMHQTRKDGVTPYFEHPMAVYCLLNSLPEAEGFDRDLMRAVAWGHDLLEDTDVSEDEIRAAHPELGPKILAGVRMLTFLRPGDPKPVDKAACKADYIARVAREASPEILAVKIADRLCNTRDFLKLEGAGREKAAGYLKNGEPLRLALGRLPSPIREKLTEEWNEVAGRLGVPSSGF